MRYIMAWSLDMLREKDGIGQQATQGMPYEQFGLLLLCNQPALVAQQTASRFLHLTEMLPCTSVGYGSPALVMMPFLGGTQAEWDGVVSCLSPKYHCVTMDLPGFGAAASMTGYQVEAMADHLIETLNHLSAHEGLGWYVLIGHSMAGKVSAVVARRLFNGAEATAAPAALILVSPSPPGPEPMTDAKRLEMLGMFNDDTHDGDVAAANRFIADNISCSLPEAILRRTASGVLEMNRKAWTAWLEHGSREDWSAYVGVIALPVLIVAGKADGALGPSAQREVTLPHFPAAELVELDCSHLAPLELPDELATAMRTFLGHLDRGIL